LEPDKPPSLAVDGYIVVA